MAAIAGVICACRWRSPGGAARNARYHAAVRPRLRRRRRWAAGTMDDTVAYAAELKARGVDVIDCSSGGILRSKLTAAPWKSTRPRLRVLCRNGSEGSGHRDHGTVGIILERSGPKPFWRAAGGGPPVAVAGECPSSIPASRGTGPTISASTADSRTGPGIRIGSGWRSAFAPSRGCGPDRGGRSGLSRGVSSTIDAAQRKSINFKAKP